MPILPLVPSGELIVKVTAFSILDIDTEERVLSTRVGIAHCNQSIYCLSFERLLSSIGLNIPLLTIITKIATQLEIEMSIGKIAWCLCR